jgi:hypothetical protein
LPRSSFPCSGTLRHADRDREVSPREQYGVSGVRHRCRNSTVLQIALSRGSGCNQPRSMAGFRERES